MNSPQPQRTATTSAPAPGPRPPADHLCLIASEITAELAAINDVIAGTLAGEGNRQYCLEAIELGLTALIGRIRTTCEGSGVQPPSHGTGTAPPADHHHPN